MTEKLYYQDPFLFSFDAVVLDITSFHGAPAAVLDRSAFFPEGGGQPGDVGTIESVQVTDTQIEDEIIYHLIISPNELQKGSLVHCSLDGEKRFARMQAHSGEHVVSGIAHRLYGVNNVGFHMDDALMTVDFDKPLSKEDLSVIEREANACVYRDLEIRAWYPDERELASLDYRSKTEGLKNPRIVTIEGIDHCACCAVHLRSTGQIGLIKILTSASHRGGVRITLICGICAYEDYVMKHEHTLHIADLLAAKHNETDIAVEKLLNKEKQTRWLMQQKTEQMLLYIKGITDYKCGNLLFEFSGFNPDELKTAVMILKSRCSGICAAISGDDNTGYYFAMTSDNIAVRDHSKAVTAALEGSGGGRYDVIQGRFRADRDTIRDFFDKYTVNEI